MGVVQRFERRLEGLVEGTFAKVFGGVVQPVEVAAALQREAGERKILVGADRILVPNEFVVQLSSSDHERLMPYEGPLRREFAAMVREHATEQGWSFVGPLDVQLQPVPELGTGTFRVSSAVVADAEPVEPAARNIPALFPAEPDQLNGEPRPALGPASLLVTDRHPEGQTSERVVALNPGRHRLGRGAEADVRLTDTGVSRLHAEIRLQDGQADLLDLGSTNGTTVNGRRISSTTLQDGDRIRLGSTGIVFRQAGGA